MAYGFKYIFNFQSQNGDEFEILIEKEGYSGEYIYRSLGRAPVLKRERNGHICGTSIEIYAECKVDGEFSEFYTSDPRMFRVTLTNTTETRIIFRGYISPELYAEPDIAPPYDVQVIATDGLGELRRYLFAPMGEQAIGTILEELLSKTGLNTDFWSNNKTLEAGGSDTVPAAKFFDYARINVDFMEGRPYYEVLEYILDSIHADIFQSMDAGLRHSWQILRETDVEAGSSVVERRGASGFDDTIVPQSFGSARTHDWWPIGQMETVIKPACKRLLVKSDAHYRDALVNGDITSDSGWTKYNAAFGDYGYYLATGGYVQQTISFQEAVRRRLKLTVRMRQYRASQSDPSADGTASIQVSMYGRVGQQTTYYLVEDSNGNYVWSTSSGSITVDLPAPHVTDTDEYCSTFEIDIPLFQNSPRNYAIAESITVKISRTSTTIPLIVRSAHLTFEEQIAGYQDTFVIDNGAREDANDVDSIFLPSVSGHYNTPGEFMYGILRNYSDNIFSIFDQVGEDYVKSCALPRLLKKGVLNVPAGTAFLPFVFRDTNGYNYIVQTVEWNVYNCEMTVEVLSLPAVSVTILEQEVSEVIFQDGTATASGSSSGSGGGGGGGTGVTSIGLSMPSGFSVSNSPITSSGTINVSLDNTKYLPTTTDKSNWDDAADKKHTHSNKSVLDGITDFDISDWNIAFQNQHTHSNKSALDLINSADVSFVKQRLKMMLFQAPIIKRIKLQANTVALFTNAPCYIVQHPLLTLAPTNVKVCLMVYRKRNGQGSLRKAHRKGWFLACGRSAGDSPAFVAAPGDMDVDMGTMMVEERWILDGIARTYCQIRNRATASDTYPDWISDVSAANDFGFAGDYQATTYKKKIHFGFAIRIDNPAFQALVESGSSLSPDTGSIQGVPRYLYSAVTPLTARMYDRTVSGQSKGGIVFEMLKL